MDDSTIRLRVLGSLELDTGGEWNRVHGRRKGALLARLVAAHGRTVPTAKLVREVWSVGVSRRSLAALQSTLSLLRRILEPDRAPRARPRVLVTTPSGYALRLPDPSVDVWHFERLVLDSGRHRDRPGQLDRLEQALALWDGPAYAEFAGQAWAGAETERLDELYRQAVEYHAEALIAAGDLTGAIVGLTTHTDDHPLREDAWRLLALALYRAGRQGDALSALRRGRGALRDQLGVDPGPALRQLETDILAQDRRLMTAGRHHEAPLVTGQQPGAPFVGREHELGRLHAAAQQVGTATSPAVAVLTGDAGIGKTALAARLAGELADLGWLNATGRCPDPAAGAPAGWAVTELVRDLAARVPPDQRTRARMAPVLDERVDLPFPLRQAVAGYLRGLATDAPLLLVVDDAHAADPATRSLLTDLPGLLAGAPVLLLVLYRPGELTGGLGALAGHVTERVTLRGLSRPAVTGLVEAVRGAAPDPAQAVAVADRTGGNPLYVRELARAVDPGTDLPDGLRDVLRPRVAALSPTARQLVERAAVAGGDVDVAVLGAALGVDEDTTVAAVEEAMAVGILAEAGGTRPRFAHRIVRDAVLADLSSVRRARLRAVLAHHSRAAGDRLVGVATMG